jgi:hypothetical protein
LLIPPGKYLNSTLQKLRPLPSISFPIIIHWSSHHTTLLLFLSKP